VVSRTSYLFVRARYSLKKQCVPNVR
jgi:hypothetical protein